MSQQSWSLAMEDSFVPGYSSIALATPSYLIAPED